jgi:hypothetical protein
VTQHPLFQIFAGRRNDLLSFLMVDYFYALADGWQPPSDGSAKVIATLRNEAPLVIEKKLGKGRVVAQLTKLSSSDTKLGRWTNWSLNPAFPVLANELVSYLAVPHDKDPLLKVGDTLVVSAEEGKYEPRFRFLLPGDANGDGADPSNGATSSATSRQEIAVEATAANSRLTARLEDVSASGIYEAQLQPLNGPVERRDFAVNAPGGEGDLAVTSSADLTQQLAGVDLQLHDAADMALNSQQLAGFQMGDALLGGLIAMLLAEQLLAYMASYHIAPPAGGSK